MSGNRSTRASDVGVLASDAVQRAYRQATDEAVPEQVWLTQVRLVVYFSDLWVASMPQAFGPSY